MDDRATGAPQAQAGVDGTLPELLDQLTRDGAEMHPALATLLATLEASQEGVVASGFIARAMHFNTRFVEIWGIPPHRAAALNDAALLALQLTRVADPARFLDFAQARHARPGQERRETFAMADGRVVECRVVPQRVRGRRTASVTCYRDVTGQRRNPAAEGPQARSSTTAIPCPTPMHIVHSA